MLPLKPDYKSTILVWDTEASFGLTSLRIDFIDYAKADITVKYVTKVNWFIGIGVTIQKFIGVNGTKCYLACVSYYILFANFRLFSPQTYHQMRSGYSSVHGNHITVHLKEYDIKINIDSK